MCSGLAVFLLSCAIIAFQIVLMRSLAVLRYHHFSYLVISTALLGFGVSGTFLHFAGRHFCKYFPFRSLILMALFTLSIPICYTLSLLLPIDIQYIFYSYKQGLLLSIYAILLFIPFFLGASIIGLAIQYYEENTGWVYGLNLLGSGVGGGIAIGMMYLISPLNLPNFVSGISVVALILWLISIRTHLSPPKKRVAVLGLGMIIIAIISVLINPPRYHMDPYKAFAHLQRLQSQADAKLLISRSSPRGQIDIYESDKLHHTLFAGLNSRSEPPEQLTLLIDGHHAGAIFKIRTKEEAEILDDTPQSLAYRLVDTPKVLLLGEVGGVNVWLARRFNASDITVVQGNPQLVDVLKEDLSLESGTIYNRPDVRVIIRDPRLFIQTTTEKFDIIHLVTGEGFSAGISGLASLHEDFLLTKEGIAQCYQRLTPRGILTLSRGIQFPPRDNIKLFALFSAALNYAGSIDVKNNLYQVRNYLAVNTLLSKNPFDQGMIAKFENECHNLLLDIEYHPSISSDRTNVFNILEGPSGKKYSYFHHAILNILSATQDQFRDEWMYNVHPPTDNSPYFYNFFKWRSLKKFLNVYGGQMLQKLELGYLILFFSFLEAILMAFIMIIFPLFWTKIKDEPRSCKIAAAIYFLNLGIAFMFVEMVFVQKFTKFLGDPIYSVSIVLVSILISAGSGSIFQNHWSINSKAKVLTAVAGILVFSVLNLITLKSVIYHFSSSPLLMRMSLTFILIMPGAFLMGWLFPIGIKGLQARTGELVPWAWGINGFGSVSAAPLAVMLSMQFGFDAVIFIALTLYIVAALAYSRLYRPE